VFHWKTFGEIHLGPLTLRTFGLCVALGVLLGAEVTARRNARFDVARDDTQRIVLWLVCAGLVGARLTWVVTNFSQIKSPLDVIAVWNGGMQFSGGFLAALAVTPWVTRGLKVTQNRRNLLDSAALGLAVGQLIGRVGCISVGEHLGNATKFFLGWTYEGGATREGPLTIGVRYHNAAIYEFLWLIPLIVVLARRARAPRYPGQVLVWLMTGYGVLRFLTDMTRAYDQRLWGLTGAQFMCLGLVVAAPFMARRWRAAGEVGEPGASAQDSIDSLAASATGQPGHAEFGETPVQPAEGDIASPNSDDASETTGNDPAKESPNS
jgi:phosphatidylglycerol:prolipoprotein diacylglycerol transferase